MNQSPLNGAQLNGAPADSVQRVALSASARAVGVAQYRVHSRATFSPTAAATASIAGRALRPVSLQGSATAQVDLRILRRVRGPVTPVGRANILAGYAVYERDYITGPVSTRGQAQVVVQNLIVARGIMGLNALARIGATGFIVPREDIRQPAFGVGEARVSLDALVMRRWPVAVTGGTMIAARESSPTKYSVPVAAQAYAVVTANESSMTFITSPVSMTATASVTLDPVVFRALVFDENAPDERTMLLSPDGRELMVV